MHIITSMAYRPKKPSNKIDKRVTIDAKHNDQIKLFKNIKKSIMQKETAISELLDRIEKIESELNNLDNHTNDYIKLHSTKMELEDDIEQLKQEIIGIMDNMDETKYYLSAGPYVLQYFKNKENISKGEVIISNKNGKIKKKPYNKNILDFFMEPQETKPSNIITFDDIDLDDSKNINKEEIDDDEKVKNSKLSFADNGLNKKKGDDDTKISNMSLDRINEKYMLIIDSSHVNNKLTEENDIDYCYDCQTEMKVHHNDGRMVCPKCGISQRVLIESDKQSCKEPPKEIVCMGYKRINHFRECVAQVQAKETTEIPDDLYDQIIFELKKERFHNMANLSYDKVKEILRKIKKNKYYEHIPHIINQLNGLPPPTYPKDLQIILDRMFNEIQIPFQKFRPKDRKNFLSYSYVLFKFFELLEMKEYCKNFNLLKSREKLYNQDVIWKKITECLGWRFIKSI